MLRNRHHRQGGKAQFRPDGGLERAPEDAGLAEIGQQATGHPGALEHRLVPGMGIRTQHLTGGGDGVLGGHFPGEEVAQQVRNEQQGLRPFQRPGIRQGFRIELDEGVDVEHGDAGAAVEGALVHPLPKEAGHGRQGALIPVVVWVAQQLAVAV